MRVQVLSSDYTRILGTIPDYQTASTTWQRLSVGTAVLVASERGIALEAYRCNPSVVPITFKAPDLPRWTGRVVDARGTKNTGQVGQMQITLVDEYKWMSQILAAPDPANPWSAQSGKSHDARVGTLVGLAKYFIRANVQRLANEGFPVPIVHTLVDDANDTSPTLVLKGRNQTLDELWQDAMKMHGYNVTVTLWLPGDPQPTGMSLTQPTLVADIVKGRDQQYVRFTDEGGGVTSRLMAASHPQAMGSVVLGPGELQSRIFQKVMATDGRVAAAGKWGFPEVTIDATDADTADIRLQRGQEKNAETAGTNAVAVEIADARPWKVGPKLDYWINDLVRAEFSGVQVSDRIDRITVTDNHEEGYKVMATFGAGRDTESADARLARTIAEVRHRLNITETGR